MQEMEQAKKKKYIFFSGFCFDFVVIWLFFPGIIFWMFQDPELAVLHGQTRHK